MQRGQFAKSNSKSPVKPEPRPLAEGEVELVAAMVTDASCKPSTAPCDVYKKTSSDGMRISKGRDGDALLLIGKQQKIFE